MTLYIASSGMRIQKSDESFDCVLLTRPNKNANTSFVQSPRRLGQARGRIRLKHYSLRIEQAYLDWIKRAVLHFDKRHQGMRGRRESVFMLP